MAKEVETKTAEETETNTAENITEEVGIVPDLNTELVKSISELKTEVAEVKKVISENKIDLSKEKSASPATPEKKEDVGLKVKNWISANANKGITEGTSSSGAQISVPQPLSEEILRLMNENGITRQYAKKIPMKGRSLKYRVYDTLDEATFESEIGNRDATSPTFVDVELVRSNLGKINLISNATIQDSPEIVTSLSKTASEALRAGEDKKLAEVVTTASGTNETKLAGTLAQGALTVKKMFEMVEDGTWNRTGNEIIGMNRKTWGTLIGNAIDESLLPTMNVQGKENFYGTPVVFLNYLDSPATDGTNKFIAFYSDLSETVGLGIRRDEVIGGNVATMGSVGNINLFTTRQTAIEFSEDIDIKALMPAGINIIKTAH